MFIKSKPTRQTTFNSRAECWKKRMFQAQYDGADDVALPHGRGGYRVLTGLVDIRGWGKRAREAQWQNKVLDYRTWAKGVVKNPGGKEASRLSCPKPGQGPITNYTWKSFRGGSRLKRGWWQIMWSIQVNFPEEFTQRRVRPQNCASPEVSRVTVSQLPADQRWLRMAWSRIKDKHRRKQTNLRGGALGNLPALWC